MKKLIIVGNSSYSEMMRNYIEQTEAGDVLAYAVDAECICQKEMGGIPVFSFEELREKFPKNEVSLIMGIGYRKMGKIRETVFEKCKAWGYQFENYIHPSAMIAKDVVIGEGNNILEGVILEAGVMIGNANLFFGGSMLGHETRVGSYNTFAGKSMTAGCVVVGEHCFLGISSAVKDHVVFKDYVLLGATAFGFKDMESHSVVMPAKSIVLEGKKSTEFF